MMENMEDEDHIDNNINKKLENIKTNQGNKTTANRKGWNRETLKNRWYDEECKIAIEEIKKTREKWLRRGRRENEEQEYHHKRKEAHKKLGIIKNICIKNAMESIEEHQKYNNIRKLYQTINQFKKGYQHKFNMIRKQKRRIGNEF